MAETSTPEQSAMSAWTRPTITRVWALGVTLLALVIGVIGGMVLQEQLVRPRLRVDLVQTAIVAVPLENRSDELAAPPEITELTSASEWVPSVPRHLRGEDYFSRLEAVERAALEALPKIRTLRRQLDSWRSRIANGESTGPVTFDLVSGSWSLIESHIFSEVRRSRAVKLPEARPAGAAAPFQVSVDDDGDFYVSGDTRQLPVIWSSYATTEAVGGPLEETGRRLAYGLASNDQAFADALVRNIEEILDSYDDTSRILDLVRAEKQRASNWKVRAMLSNSGGAPISVSPEARLYVRRSDGRQYTLDLIATREAEGFVGSVVPLLRNESPLLVPAGGAIAVSFLSEQQLGVAEGYQELLEAFESRNWLSVLAVLPIRPTRTGDLEPQLSNRYLFGQPELEHFPASVSW